MLRVEHLFQPSDKPTPAAVEVQLDNLINQFRAVSAHEFMAGGDVDIKTFSRLQWKSSDVELATEKIVNEACTLDNLCLEVSPGDLRTIVITGHFMG